ncbi:MAG: phosphoribosylformylglycinamidine cyclo-ligase [Chloroflexi bacterium]|nr:phosphoribosylformylglycinamidine cyclo-ligase [Chloroflexota bacterium]
MTMKETYAQAGVNTDMAAKVKQLIGGYARTTARPEVLSGVGFFGGMFELQGDGGTVLVSSVDGVGTKLKIAAALDRHDTMGIDLVNHCVNDIFTSGAEPLFFLDYIAMGKLVPERVEAIVKGLARACREVGCALIGGETAEMPGIYTGNDYDLVGFIVGRVAKEKIIMGKAIAPGDAILGLPSSGLHTNGYSLARRVFGELPGALNTYYPELGRSLGEALLEPHRCYFNQLRGLLPFVKGLAHITGGGLIGNLPRILPQGMAAHLHSDKWTVSPVFRLIQKQGNIELAEMFHVFNMGIGMVVVCASENVGGLSQALPEARTIGEIIKQTGEARVIIDGTGYHRDKVA